MPTLPPDVALVAACEFEPHPADDVVELSVLLAGWQLSALERAAEDAGLTTAQMMRRLVHRFLLDNC